MLPVWWYATSVVVCYQCGGMLPVWWYATSVVVCYQCGGMLPVSRSLTEGKHCSLWIDITSDSVHKTGVVISSYMSCILVHNISGSLQTMADFFDRTKKGKAYSVSSYRKWKIFVRAYVNSSAFARH